MWRLDEASYEGCVDLKLKTKIDEVSSRAFPEGGFPDLGRKREAIKIFGGRDFCFNVYLEVKRSKISIKNTHRNSKRT